ncbi:MAG TPA: hypothetical protein VHZ02_17210 [Acidimicrobiales bacterium]|jgi:hypothetical protein|nr:hypothetical protein [Acidimicrobiales bacterium]
MRWCTRIAQNLSEERESRTTPVEFLVHYRDKRFGAMFDEVFKAKGHRDPPHAVAGTSGECLCGTVCPDRSKRVS